MRCRQQATMRKFVGQGGPALRRAPGKRAHTGDVTADDECLDGLGALEGVDRLDVEHMPTTWFPRPSQGGARAWTA